MKPFKEAAKSKQFAKISGLTAPGTYPAMWATTNQQGVYCDADCTKGAHVSVPATGI